jgi:DDE superfamily endonuclease
MWCIPHAPDGAYVAAMERVLRVYQRLRDDAYPVVCFDEGRKELRGEVRDPWPMVPGRPAREDCEYSRHGSASLLLWCAPLLGLREITVSERRTKQDWAKAIQALVDHPGFAEAVRITVVLDNLNTHTLSSLYETFPPREALRIAEKIDLVYTPKHGSWLNIAEIELSALGHQCLDRRIPDQEMLTTEVDAWQRQRNADAVTVDWQFRADDARVKLHRLYPVLSPSSGMSNAVA